MVPKRSALGTAIHPQPVDPMQQAPTFESKPPDSGSFAWLPAAQRAFIDNLRTTCTQ